MSFEWTFWVFPYDMARPLVQFNVQFRKLSLHRELKSLSNKIAIQAINCKPDGNKHLCIKRLTLMRHKTLA